MKIKYIKEKGKLIKYLSFNQNYKYINRKPYF